jgi:hypothetical protein
LPAQPVDATQAISLLAFRIPKSYVAVRLAGARLCSDEFASTPTSRCPSKSTVSTDHWCSHWTRAATDFADRRSKRRCWSLTY